MTRHTLYATAALLALAMPATAQTPAQSRFIGTWEGTLDAGTARLRTALVVERDSAGGLKGALISIDQGNARIPGTITTSGDTLTIALSAAGAGFKGVLTTAGDSLNGTFTQGGSLPLKLKRSQGLSSRVRPQDPKPPFPYRTKEVTFESAPGVRLAGTITTPEGNGPFPAVVFVTGSGPQNRDEELLEHRPFLVIADYLARHGIASLRYDDRGIAKSTGSFATATSADFANDAEAAVRVLRAEPGINSKHVGILGHSEGGMIAPIVAARNSDVAFIVLLAGPGISGDSTLILQTRAMAAGAGASQEALDRGTRTNRLFYDIAKANTDSATMMAGLRRAAEKIALEAKPGATADPNIVNGIMQQLVPITTPWYRYFLRYDPRPTLERVHVPVLALNGSKDVQVLPKENLSAIKSALATAGNKDVEVVELPELNHLFQHATSGLVAEYGGIDETVSPDVLAKVAAWITQRFGAR
jgi:pimeloyl-ACP methyl ester carboxylesterase